MARTRQLPTLLLVLRTRYPHLPIHYDRNAETKLTNKEWRTKLQKKRYQPKSTLDKSGLVILYTAIESYGVDAVRQIVQSDPKKYKVFLETTITTTKKKPVTTTSAKNHVIGFVAGSEKDITLSDIKKEFGTLDRFYQAIKNSSSRSPLDPLPTKKPKTFKGILELVNGLSHSQRLFRVSGPTYAFYLERLSS